MIFRAWRRLPALPRLPIVTCVFLAFWLVYYALVVDCSRQFALKLFSFTAFLVVDLNNVIVSQGHLHRFTEVIAWQWEPSHQIVCEMSRNCRWSEWITRKGDSSNCLLILKSLVWIFTFVVRNPYSCSPSLIVHVSLWFLVSLQCLVVLIKCIE